MIVNAMLSKTATLRRAVCYVLLLVGVPQLVCLAQTTANSQAGNTVTTPAAHPAHDVPVIDGGVGPCSLDLSVTTSDGKPVYAAAVKVHIAYGFAGFRRLDLEASTNVDGKVRFVGLPSRVHRPPLEFHASSDQMVGAATYDPDSECHAKHDIVVDMPKPPAVNKPGAPGS